MNEDKNESFEDIFSEELEAALGLTESSGNNNTDENSSVQSVFELIAAPDESNLSEVTAEKESQDAFELPSSEIPSDTAGNAHTEDSFPSDENDEADEDDFDVYDDQAATRRAAPYFQEPAEQLPPDTEPDGFESSDNEYSDEDPDDDEDDDNLPARGLPKAVKALLYIAVVFVVSFGISIAVWNLSIDVFGFGKPDSTVQITVRENETIDEISDDLESSGLINYKWLFRMFAGLTNAEAKISSGTYTLNTNFDYHAIVNGLRANSSAREVVDVTIPEGYTCRQIFAALEEHGVCTAEELEEAAASYHFSYDFLQEIPYGNPYRLEGYLFPDTYQFYVNDTAERVLDKFLDNFNTKFTDTFRSDIDELNDKLREKLVANGFTESEIEASLMDINKIIIIASMLEKESGSTSESSSIASVIYNRLCSKVYPMLQIESTLRYALNNWTDELTDADLAYDSAYNTNRYAGLPEGPISNPGIDSIRAALYPRDTSYYFYALNPATGLHHFSDNYYDHLTFLEGLEE